MNKKSKANTINVSQQFLNKFGSHIQGCLCGFDRLRLRGTLRHLFQPTVMESYLNACRVLIKDFSRFAEGITNRAKQAMNQIAEKANRPLIYLNSSQISKEEEAKKIAAKDGIRDGLVAILTCVEPCMSYRVRGDRQSKKIHLVLEPRKCLFYYHYFLHPTFGWMHARVQTWFPFTIDFCINGRHWLSRQMDQAGLEYRKEENCFVWISDWTKAQKLMDKQLKTDWPKSLKKILGEVLPTHSQICRPIAQQYYWTASQSEYATDIVFKSPEFLSKLYPNFVHHSISSFASPDVMRFLGRSVPTTTGRVHGKFEGEIISDMKHRPEGIRVKHTLKGNSIKLYDKQGRMIRVETTINHPEEFKVYRHSERDPQGELAWRELRRGVADLHRRAEVSKAANNRYLDALESTCGTEPIATLVSKVCRRRTIKGNKYRGLRPWSPEDHLLLESISSGEYTINGFRNGDLRKLLYSKKATKQEQRRRSSAITRKLRLLRAHGIIRKVSGTHRYVVTGQGRKILTALMAAYKADVDQLTKLAA